VEANVSDRPDLAESPALAAANAVRARRHAIEAGGVGAPRAIVVEVEPANRDRVLNIETHLSWRRVIRGATE